MRPLLALAILALAGLAPVASATTVVTKSCTLGTSAIVSLGKCSVSNYANAGLRVTITVYDTTRGNVHVDMVNTNDLTHNIEWECLLTGAAHSCTRIIDTRGEDVGVWGVTGYYVGVDRAARPGDAPATMTVDFLTF